MKCIGISTIALTVALASAAPQYQGPGQRRGFPGRGPGRPGYAVTQNPPQPKTEAERQILAILDEMARAGGTFLSVPMQDGRLLRLLTEAVGAKNVVEIGTSTGYSGLWLCMAVRNTGGRLTTFEFDKTRASTARAYFKRAGVDDLVSLVEGDAHERISMLKEPIDVLFIDADKEGYLDYLNKLLPLVRPGGLILAHNVDVASEYDRAITSNRNLETVFYMDGGGLSVTLKKR